MNNTFLAFRKQLWQDISNVLVFYGIRMDGPSMPDGFFQGSIQSTQDLLVGMERAAKNFFWQQEVLGLRADLFNFADDAAVYSNVGVR